MDYTSNYRNIHGHGPQWDLTPGFIMLIIHIKGKKVLNNRCPKDCTRAIQLFMCIKEGVRGQHGYRVHCAVSSGRRYYTSST